MAAGKAKGLAFSDPSVSQKDCTPVGLMGGIVVGSWSSAGLMQGIAVGLKSSAGFASYLVFWTDFQFLVLNSG